jgi:outer membrane cobalamin receptor
MKQILVLLLIFPLILPANQDASLSGYVKDSSTGETLIGATVYIKDTKFGAYTNKSGFYAIRGIPDGTYTLSVSMVGYAKLEEEITLVNSETKRIDRKLEPSISKTDEVTVIAERQADKKEIVISRTDVPVRQLQQIRFGGEADLFRALQFLPGVLTSSMISNGLYIRGGSPDQNLVLLDGATVYNPSHLFGFFSTFNTEALKDVELLKGGFNAEYGGRLSSVINITQKDGNREQYEGTASLGIISAKASVQGPVGNGSFFVSGRRTYFDLVTEMIDQDPANPFPDYYFYDVNAKLVQDLGENDKIFFSGFSSADQMGYEAFGINMSLYIKNLAGSARWTHIFDDNLFTTLLFSASKYNNGLYVNTGYEATVDNYILDYTGKFNAEWFASDKLTTKFGVEYNNYTFSYNQDFTNGENTDGEKESEGGITKFDVLDHNISTFAQANYELTDDLNLQAGLRASYFNQANQTVLDPRLAARYQLTENYALKASWGIYHQNLKLATQPDFSFFDTWMGTDSSLNLGKAVHYILSLEGKIAKEYELNLDVYYKQLTNINELNRYVTKIEVAEDVLFEGRGESMGAEILFQKKYGDFTGWIGYSFGFVNAQLDSVNDGAWYSPKYDRRHDFKVVANYILNKTWEFGSSFVFQSGQGYTAMTSRYQGLMPGNNYGRGKVVPGKIFSQKMPNTHYLNANVNYSFEIFGRPSKLILDIYNIYSRRDIWFRRYVVNEGEETYIDDIKLLPILPTLSWEIKF